MLYIMYWRLNENMSEKERALAAHKLRVSRLFPPKGVILIREDITPDLWGVTIMEAETPKDLFEAINIWRAAAPGFFKTTRVSPAMPLQEYASIHTEMLKKIAAAQNDSE